MFEGLTLDNAIRSALANASDDRVVEIVLQLPLAADETLACEALGDCPEAFRARRNELFIAAWNAEPSFPEPPALQRAVAAHVRRLTGELGTAEVLLALIGWRMAAEQAPRLRELRLRLEAEKAGLHNNRPGMPAPSPREN